MAAPALIPIIKKAATVLLTNPKVWKIIGGIVLGIIVIIAMPIAVILGLFSGDIVMDANRLNEIISENQTAIVEKWTDIETAMTDAGFGSERVDEAMVLYNLVLYKHSENEGFTDSLVACFENGQTDEQLVANVNTTFGTSIRTQDFTNAMQQTREGYNTSSDTSTG